MNIFWKNHPENPEKIQIFINNKLWQELQGRRYRRRLPGLLPVASRKEFLDKFFELEKKLAKASAFRLLGLKAYLMGDLEVKLGRMEYSSKAIFFALEECLRLGFLDDEGYIDQLLGKWIRKGYGPKWVRGKLMQKKIPIDTIDNLLQNEYSKERRLEALQKLMEKNSKMDKQKLMRYCYSKGFDIELIYEVL